jgi:hypothetical protein
MKLNELFEAVAAPETLEPVTVTAKGADSFIVGTKATKGPSLEQIYWIWKDFEKKKGVTMKSKAGLELNFDRMFKSKPNGIVLTFKDVEGAKEAIEASAAKASAKVDKDVKSKAKWKDGADDRKKEASKLSSAQRAVDMKKYEQLYGKGTWNRVTYRQEGGDDGYCYVVRVDGRTLCTGQTLNQAMHEKKKAVDELAKKGKLGKYAEAK